MKLVQSFRSTLALALITALLAASLVGCTRKPNPGETPEEFAKYRRAFYSAEVVYGIDALGDIIEILKNASVVSADSGKRTITFTDQGLIAADEIIKLLESGLPAGKFDKVRTAIGAFKAAVANGAIKFNSQRAQQVYFNVVSTVEVSVNLWEAFSLNKQQDVAKYAKQRDDRMRALSAIKRDGVQEPWWNAAIVRGTQLATDIAGVAPLTASDIWPKVKERSALAHTKNTQRVANW